MTHSGLPLGWAIVIGISMLLLSVWAIAAQSPNAGINSKKISLTSTPLVGGIFRYLSGTTWLLLLLKIVFASIFILIITAGLWGTAIVERNLATTLTWNLWWTGLIIAVLFSGSAWCAVCPWDNIATWLVNHKLWQRSNSNSRLQLKVPHSLRNVWPASLLFIGFTWLELGIGIVSSPYATALLALVMVILATTALALFEGKAFCRYMCPVGRTVGAYSQLSPIALRPIDNDICKNCKTLECFHGSEKIAPCPTKLIMGRLQENTYCTSCGNCTLSCPSKNISWQLRSPSSEAIKDARPHLDEAFFMLILLALTMFHGLTMLDGWQSYMTLMAQLVNDNSQLIISFSVGLVASLLIPSLFYLLSIGMTLKLCVNKKGISRDKVDFNKLFSGFAFTALPLAFAYHIAHNLTHFVRESSDWLALLSNPLGKGTEPLSMMEKHMRHMDIMISENVLFTLQGLIMLAGFAISVLVIRHRGYRLFAAKGIQLLPILIFAMIITSFNLFMLVQPMTMRM
ncbi:4Fe-4S binding protein [Candidatus Colwellia aromaticivorans]|uniref:4Fe-4S binding protein n=1 Tax=Candidatus Colwellia aromaticivorans TaxID=2267621 RepID=UPI001B34A773|nr:4Fe-4S binding protein [Candidatus Colwellia aromaticivorans]